MLLLVFIAIAVGIVLLVSWIFYDKFILMAQVPPKPKEGEDDSDAPKEPVVPGTYDLFGRMVGFTTLAFVFMLAFVLNTFWTNVQTAQSATQSESANLARLSSLAEDIPDPASAAAVQKAVAEYAASITDVQWPLLRVADNTGATSAVFDANIALFQTIQQAQEADGSSSRVWNWIDSTMSDLGQDSADRLGQLPAGSAAARIWTVVILGLAMLIMTTAFMPTRVKPYRISISILAALTALMVFVMVQASNPYAQHVTPEIFMDARQSGSP
ncbi:MAG TPA: hypothetical protein DCQ36_05075 [Actinobacteria bacterium]|nr:hypothetical protein [Actinomycetota bacterium]